MNPTCSIRNIRALPLLALALMVATARSEPAPATLTVYHAFATAPSGTWTRVPVPDDLASWHVGGPDGPAPSRAQLDAVRASLRWVAVGATCPSASAAATHYPCGVELAAPVGSAGQGAALMNRPWTSTSGALLTGYDRNAPTSRIAFSNTTAGAHGSRPGFLSMLADNGAFVGLYTQLAPADRTSRLPGFRIRIRANGLISAPHGGPAQGWLILSAERPSGTAARERATSGPATPA